MALVDMNSLQFYQPPAKAGVPIDERPTTSSLRVPAPHGGGKDPVALAASQGSSRVLHNPDLIQPQNLTGRLQKDSLDSFGTPGLGLSDSKAERNTASMPSERVVASWDDMIPLSCRSAGDGLHRPRFRHPPGTICKTGVLGKPTAGNIMSDPIEVDSGDDSSSDVSGSDTGQETSSATTPTCAISPVVSSTNEGKMKQNVVSGESTGGLVASALNLQEHQDSSWLNIDHFPDSGLVLEDNAAEDKCQKMGNIEDKSGPDGTKDGEAEDGSHEMDHNVIGAEDGPRDEDGVDFDGEDIITDPEMDGIEVDDDGSHSKGGHRAGVDAHAKGEQNPFEAELPQAPVHSSTPPLDRRCRGRPRRSRTTITVGNAMWEVTKIAGDEQSGEGRVIKVQAEAWLAEEDLPSLREAIAAYRGKQGRSRGKRKSICGRTKRSAPKRKE